MNLLGKLSQFCCAALVASGPAVAQGAPDVQGFWAGGYVDGRGGQIQFQLTIIDGLGELKYDTSNWGDLGFSICEYLFPVENGQPGKVLRNSGAGTGDCLGEPVFTLTRANKDVLSLAFTNPEIDLEAAELSGVLRPFDPAEAHAPIANLDILGATPGMTLDQIEQLLGDKGYARQENRDRLMEYQDFTRDMLAWGRAPNDQGKPTDWFFASFSAKKSWAPDDAPVAMSIARDWTIPTSEAIAGATMVESLATKYGPRSNSINEARFYDRSGTVLQDAYSCGDGPHQPIQSSYQLDDELGNEEISVTCGAVLDAYVSTDSSTGRAVRLKLRITDPDPLWDDFWKTWSHSEGARIKAVYEGVAGATGKAPEL